MLSYKNYLSNIISELKSIQNANSISDEAELFKTILPAPDGYGVVINKKILGIIDQLANSIRSNCAEVSDAYNQEDLVQTLKNILGLELKQIDLDNDICEIVKYLRETLFQQIKSYLDQDKHFEYQFPLGYFLANDVEKFSIGPVTIFSREAWLAKIEAEKRLSLIATRRIRRSWSGATLKRRNPVHPQQTNDAILEKYVLDLVGDDKYVCVVAANQKAKNYAQHRALTTTRLALTLLALLTRDPAKTIAASYPSFDNAQRQRRILGLYGENGYYYRVDKVNLPIGPHANTENIEVFRRKNSGFFDSASAVLHYSLSPIEDGEFVESVRKSALALMWFRSACEESNHIFAITKTAFALDVLAKKSGEEHVRLLVKSTLKIDLGEDIFEDSSSAGQTITAIFKRIRSPAVHGLKMEFDGDNDVLRSKAIQLTAEVLRRHLSNLK